MKLLFIKVQLTDNEPFTDDAYYEVSSCSHTADSRTFFTSCWLVSSCSLTAQTLRPDTGGGLQVTVRTSSVSSRLHSPPRTWTHHTTTHSSLSLCVFLHNTLRRVVTHKYTAEDFLSCNINLICAGSVPRTRLLQLPFNSKGRTYMQISNNASGLESKPGPSSSPSYPHLRGPVPSGVPVGKLLRWR